MLACSSMTFYLVIQRQSVSSSVPNMKRTCFFELNSFVKQAFDYVKGYKKRYFIHVKLTFLCSIKFMHKKFFESVKGNVFFKIEIWLKQKIP